MANLTAHRTIKSRENGSYHAVRYPIKNTQQLYEGGWVNIETATGKLVPYTPATGAIILGRTLPTKKDRDDATYLKGDTTAPIPEAIVFLGSEIVENYDVTGATAITDNGALVYLSDDNVMTLTAGTNGKPLGRVARWISGTKCDVLVFSYEERASYSG